MRFKKYIGAIMPFFCLVYFSACKQEEVSNQTKDTPTQSRSVSEMLNDNLNVDDAQRYTREEAKMCVEHALNEFQEQLDVYVIDDILCVSEIEKLTKEVKKLGDWVGKNPRIIATDRSYLEDKIENSPIGDTWSRFYFFGDESNHHGVILPALKKMYKRDISLCNGAYKQGIDEE